MAKASLTAFFEPRSIAVVGASGEKKGGFAEQVLWNLRNFGVAVPVTAIHPRQASVDGFPCLPSLSAMPERPDLCVIGVRRQSVQPVLEECVRLGVPAVTIVATGFAEQHNDEGNALQQGLDRAHAGASVTRIIGPNTIGVCSFVTNTVSTATGNMPSVVPHGPVAIVSKSGGISTAILSRGIAMGLGFCFKVAIGNEMDVTFGEVLEYIAHRGESRLVICYMEGVRDLRDLRRGIAACNRAGKPVIFIKGGTTAAGSRAAASHTGRLTGDGAVWKGIAAQLGVIEAASIDHALTTALLFSRHGVSSGKTVGGMGMGGGLTVMLADMFVRGGLAAPAPAPETQARMRAALTTVTPSNPFDTGGVYLSGDGTELPRALRALAEDPGMGIIVIMETATQRERTRVIIPAIIKATADLPKPVVLLSYDLPGCEAHTLLREAGLLVIEAPDTGILAIKSWLEYSPAEHASDESSEQVGGNRVSSQVMALIAQAGAAGHATLLEDEGKAILSEYGVSSPAERAVTSVDEAIEAAGRLGYPVALKLLSRQMLHRGIGRGVLLNLADARALRDAFERMQAHAKDWPDARYLVQRMAAPGMEMLIGAMRDPELGLVMAIGAGGANVESRKDACFCTLPVSRPQLCRMLDRLPVLQGRADIDREALLQAAADVARLLEDLAEHVDELDINPVIVGAPGKGLVAVDALFVLRRSD